MWQARPTLGPMSPFPLTLLFVAALLGSLLVAFGVIGALLEMPFELYSTFRIEQRFGFNRLTWRLYLADLIKGVAVGVAIGLPIAALILWIMGAAGPMWWLWAWGAWMGFTILMYVLVPTVS